MNTADDTGVLVGMLAEMMQAVEILSNLITDLNRRVETLEAHRHTYAVRNSLGTLTDKTTGEPIAERRSQ